MGTPDDAEALARERAAAVEPVADESYADYLERMAQPQPSLWRRLVKWWKELPQ